MDGIISQNVDSSGHDCRGDKEEAQEASGVLVMWWCLSWVLAYKYSLLKT